MLDVVRIRKKYGEHTAVDDVTFSQSAGQFTVLLGPSGCGKTTTLRAVAGLERLDHGQIRIRESVVDDPDRHIFVPPNRRRVAMVFQSYALWPHMTVQKNVEFPLRVRRVPRQELKRLVARTLASVGLEDLSQRHAGELSGGQQQRVALARALVYEPDLLLLDEPLSNLDAELRDTLRFELKAIQQERGVTTLYVTHDQSEAFILGDQVLVMNQGKILQVGEPMDIYRRPSDEFVARFTGTENIISCSPVGTLGDDTVVELFNGVRLSGSFPKGATASDGCVAAFRGQDVELKVPEQNGADSHLSSINKVTARVVDVSFVGEAYRVELDADSQPIIATLSYLPDHVRNGEDVLIELPGQAVSLLPGSAGN